MPNAASPAALRCLILCLALLAAACGRADDEQAAAARWAASWPAFVDRYIEQHFEAQPLFAVRAGRHEFDGRMPDWSAAGIAREVQRLERAREAILGFASDALTNPQRFERDYLLSVVDSDLFWLKRAEWPFRNPAWYLDRLDPEVYLTREYAPLEKRLAAYVGYARAIPTVASHVRANLRTPLPASYVERAVAGFRGYAQFYRENVPRVFAPVQDAAQQRQLAQANEAAASAMEELARWFEAQREHATGDFALGEALFTEMLRATERVDTPLPELLAAGRADLERNLAALEAACTKYAPRRSLRACIERMDANEPEDGTVEAARRQLGQLREFVVEQRIVAVPGAEEARVEEAPPYNRANFAYIDIPGPYERGLPSTYYVAPPDPSWSPAEQAAYVPGRARLLYTSVHEVWPGHFLQFMHSNRSTSRVGSLWVGYAFAEGWAHYAEEMMWEMGLGEGDPEQHVGQLASALLRNVRFIAAIGLHTQGMTLEQAERLFRDSAFADPGNARQQAARGTYDPAYLNYTLGKLMIRRLRADWLGRISRASAMGDERTLWRGFHDRLLSYGGPPIPLVRRELVGGGGALL